MSHELKLFTEYDWKTFMAASLEMNSTEYYYEKYPLLQEYCEEFGITEALYTTFLHNAIRSGLTYQQCLDDIVTMLLNGSHYSHEIIEHISVPMQYCIDQGAIFPQERMFTHLYPADKDLSCEVVEYMIRGMLVDYFHKVIECDKIADWSAIEACNSEEFDEDDEPENNDINRFRHLKSMSEYLLTTYPNPKDKKDEARWYYVEMMAISNSDEISP